MKGLQNPSLLVYLMALFIVLAIMLAITLVMTAVPLTDPSSDFRVNMAILRDNGRADSTQCPIDPELTMQKTCLNSINAGVKFDLADEP